MMHKHMYRKYQLGSLSCLYRLTHSCEAFSISKPILSKRKSTHAVGRCIYLRKHQVFHEKYSILIKAGNTGFRWKYRLQVSLIEVAVLARSVVVHFGVVKWCL